MAHRVIVVRMATFEIRFHGTCASGVAGIHEYTRTLLASTTR